MSNSAVNPIGFAGRSKDRNYLLNSAFDLWQRGLTFEGIVDGITTEGIYTADRWIALNGGAGVTIQRQTFADGQTQVPGHPDYFFRYNMNGTTGSHPAIMQKIEDVATLSGKRAALSYYARVTGITAGTTSGIGSTGTIPIVLRVRQFLGVGATGSGGFTSNSIEVTAGATITGSWVKYTHSFLLAGLTGCTFGTSGTDFLSVEWRLPGGTWGVNPVAGNSGDIDITNKRTIGTAGNSNMKYVLDLAIPQFEESVATEFERRPIVEEQWKCERYFARTFQRGVTVAAINLGLTQGAIAGYGNGSFVGAGWEFPNTMRTIPLVTLWSHAVATGVSWAAGIGATADAISPKRAFIKSTSGSPAAATLYFIHATVAAEI